MAVQEQVTNGAEHVTVTTASSANEILTKVYEALAAYGLKIIAALLILIIGLWAAKVIAKIVKKQMGKTKIDPTLVAFFYHLIHIALVVFVIIAAFGKAGIPVGSFIAVVGAAGLAIGFALQGSLSNFAAGIMLIIFKPFKVSDFIKAGGEMGAVQEIQIFNTIMNSPDNVRIIVPNAQITAGSITNYTANGTRRMDLTIGVSYEDDLQKTQQVIRDVISADERVLAEPAPVVAVKELADSSVNFAVRPWVNTSDYWNVYFDMTEKIKVALEANGITIPFPQRDVHMINPS